MKVIKIIAVIILLFNSNILKGEDLSLQNKITKNLRCLICQGQSVYDSDSEFALSLKLVVKNKLNDGLSEKKFIIFGEKYGEWILYDLNLIKILIFYGFCHY